jgi:hypothetical protein
MVESEVVYAPTTREKIVQKREDIDRWKRSYLAARNDSGDYSRVELVVSWTNGSAAVFAEEPESKV